MTYTNTEKRILRIKQFSMIIGLARSTIYDRLNPKSPRYDPSFPKPIRLGMTSVGWLQTEVDHWIQSRVRERISGCEPSARAH